MSKLVPGTLVNPVGKYGAVCNVVGKVSTNSPPSGSAWYESILNWTDIADVAVGLLAKYSPTLYPHSESSSLLSPPQFTI